VGRRWHTFRDTPRSSVAAGGIFAIITGRSIERRLLNLEEDDRAVCRKQLEPHIRTADDLKASMSGKNDSPTFACWPIEQHYDAS
jgi:hypothetical protein